MAIFNYHLYPFIGIEKPQPLEQIHGLTGDRAAETLEPEPETQLGAAQSGILRQ